MNNDEYTAIYTSSVVVDAYSTQEYNYSDELMRMNGRECTFTLDAPTESHRGANRQHIDHGGSRITNPSLVHCDGVSNPPQSLPSPFITPSQSSSEGATEQVTDSIDFPLFDIWIESDCVRSTWILESYGRTVLLISESSSLGCFFSRKKPEPPTIVITDWNGDLFGYFVPGNPFLVEDSDKQTVAKLIASDAGNGRDYRGCAYWNVQDVKSHV